MGPRPGRTTPRPPSLRPAVALASLAAFAPLTLAGATGCVTVKPYERQILAQPEMTPATDALEESFYSHVESAREGAFGGHGASGGGCGCG